MAETPKNKIEKLLSDYAEQRRKDAGTPEMHPATRRMLHSEVKQQFGTNNTTSARPKQGVWVSLWPRIAAACAVLAVMATIVVLTIPPGKTSSSMDLALMKESAPAVESATAPLPTPMSVAPMAARDRADDAGERAFAIGAKMEPMAAISAPSAMVRSADAAKMESFSAPAEADAVELKADARRVALADSPASSGGRGENVAVPAPAMAPSADTSSSRNSAMMAKAATAGRQTDADQFLANSSTQRFRNYAVVEQEQAVATVTVLDEFVVEQNGNVLKVVDRDGSVYNGYMEAAPMNEAATNLLYRANTVATVAAEGPSRTQATRTVSKQSADAYAGADVPASAALAQVAPPAEAQNYFFRVEGTNRSLQQRVVFTGNMIQTDLTAGGQSELANTRNFQQQNRAQTPLGQNASQLQNNFINGRVILNNSKTAMELNAVSVEP